MYRLSVRTFVYSVDTKCGGMTSGNSNVNDSSTRQTVGQGLFPAQHLGMLGSLRFNEYAGTRKRDIELYAGAGGRFCPVFGLV